MITVGIVVDTNDPSECGRVRAVCAQWGDSYDSNVEDLPWILYGASIIGVAERGYRGPEQIQTTGKMAYGMWNIPKVGAQILVACIDGNKSNRVYVGAIPEMASMHTMPHGRYNYQAEGSGSLPHGPHTSSDKAIEPLATNLKSAFGSNTTNHEYMTRGADYSVSKVLVENLGNSTSNTPDDYRYITKQFWTQTNGYQINRMDATHSGSMKRYSEDNQVLAITSFGFHSLSMDDRQENCRVRIRTTTGHQILMDDTNERIYIATNEGANWIEMDSKGNIDMFSDNKISIHSVGDLNLTSDKCVRLYGKEGIHAYTPGSLHLNSFGATHILADGAIHLTSSSTTNIKAGGQVLVSAGVIHLNGPSAAPATKAKWTNRVPTHEPFARTSTASDYTHSPQHPYDHKDVNVVDGDKTYKRGTFWRR